jgi:NADH-quinone oxidoreductase subunit N
MLNNVESLKYFLPEMIVALTILGIILVDLGIKKARKKPISIVMFIGLALAGVFALITPHHESKTLFFGMVVLDPFAVFFKLILIVIAVLAGIFSLTSKEIKEKNFGEYLGFIAATTFGGMLLAESNHMLMVFLSFELVSIPCYVLAGYIHKSQRSSEASLKYVIYGAASSGLMVYGISLLFGATGSLSFEEIRQNLISMHGNEFLILASLIFILAGIAYKIAAFPFHMWCPDIYEGAPTPITAFLSVGPKAAGFAVLVRILLGGFSSAAAGNQSFLDVSSVDWPLLLAIISAVTMSLGNLLAINQSNIKRLLAYSSIAHAGYILMGVVALTVLGVQAVLFYFVVYILMNLGAFLVVINFRNDTGSELIDDYRGLGWSSATGAVVAVAMTVFLLSLTGIPPFGGFIGKLYLFASVIQEKRFAWLAVVAIANSVISLYYYARIIKMMFLKGYVEEEMLGIKPHASSALMVALLVILAVGVTVSGIFWGPIARWVGTSATFFLQ